MTYTADFNIDGKTFKVIRCEYSFTQNVDLFGKPVPKVNSDTIKLVIYGTEDETCISWAANSNKKMGGTISFYRSDQTVFKEIKFEDGYCIKFKEDIQPLSKGVQYKHFIEISANRIGIGDIKHDNHWPD